MIGGPNPSVTNARVLELQHRQLEHTHQLVKTQPLSRWETNLATHTNITQLGHRWLSKETNYHAALQAELNTRLYM